MKAKILICIALAGIIIVLLGLTLTANYARTEGGGELLWNADGAYLFIGMNEVGYRFSYLGRAVDEVKEIFPFGAPTPDNKHSSLLVLRVTPSSVQRYLLDSPGLGTIAPLDGSLYATLAEGKALRWSGDHFDPATTDEATRLRNALRSGQIPSGPSYDNVQGWSMRTVAGKIVGPPNYAENDAKVTIELEGKPLTFIMNSGFISHHAYVDLILPGQSPQRIWSLDEQPRRVSEMEYRNIFKN